MEFFNSSSNYKLVPIKRLNLIWKVQFYINFYWYAQIMIFKVFLKKGNNLFRLDLVLIVFVAIWIFGFKIKRL